MAQENQTLLHATDTSKPVGATGRLSQHTHDPSQASSTKPHLGLMHLLRQDWLIASALALLVVATRLPFRTVMLYNWDSANFALALDHFDVTRHFPHPPGYFFYVMVARGIRTVLSDANASLVAEGILFSALAVAALYLLGVQVFNRRTGLIAALLLAFSVTFWSLGTVALPYVSLAFFSTAMAFFSYRAVFARKDETVLLSIVYALGGGFRPDLMLFLGPLWLLAVSKKTPARIALGMVVVIVVFLLWYVPTVWLSGGIQGYHSTLLAYLQVDVAQKYSPTHRGLPALLVNVRDTLAYLFYALYFALIPLLYGLAIVAKRIRSRGINWRLPAFVACWIAPMALFYLFIHVGDPGYVFTILPALLLLAARAITWNPTKGLAVALTAIVLLGNIGLALFYPRQLTLVGTRESDRATRSKIEYIGTNVAPTSTLLVSYETYRHLQYYLPRHRSAWIDIFDPREQVVGISPEVEQVILVDRSIQQLGPRGQSPATDAGLQLVPTGGVGQLIFTQQRLSLK